MRWCLAKFADSDDLIQAGSTGSLMPPASSGRYAKHRIRGATLDTLRHRQRITIRRRLAAELELGVERLRAIMLHLEPLWFHRYRRRPPDSELTTEPQTYPGLIWAQKELSGAGRSRRRTSASSSRRFAALLHRFAARLHSRLHYG